MSVSLKIHHNQDNILSFHDFYDWSTKDLTLSLHTGCSTWADQSYHTIEVEKFKPLI